MRNKSLAERLRAKLQRWVGSVGGYLLLVWVCLVADANLATKSNMTRLVCGRVVVCQDVICKERVSQIIAVDVHMQVCAYQ